MKLLQGRHLQNSYPIYIEKKRKGGQNAHYQRTILMGKVNRFVFLYYLRRSFFRYIYYSVTQSLLYYIQR